jgi:hypothetical protein
MIECALTASSPQKSSSPSKSGSSSTHFEHGQKLGVSSPLSTNGSSWSKNRSENDNGGTRKIENNGVGSQPSKSQSLLLREPRNNDHRNSESNSKESIRKLMNGSSDDSQNNDLDHCGGKTKGKDDKDDTVDNVTDRRYRPTFVERRDIQQVSCIPNVSGPYGTIIRYHSHILRRVVGKQLPVNERV